MLCAGRRPAAPMAAAARGGAVVGKEKATWVGLYEEARERKRGGQKKKEREREFVDKNAAADIPSNPSQPSSDHIPSPLLLGAREVRVGARVDLDELARLDEQRHVDHGAGLERRGLRAACCVGWSAGVYCMEDCCLSRGVCVSGRRVACVHAQPRVLSAVRRQAAPPCPSPPQPSSGPLSLTARRRVALDARRRVDDHEVHERRRLDADDLFFVIMMLTVFCSNVVKTDGGAREPAVHNPWGHVSPPPLSQQTTPPLRHSATPPLLHSTTHHSSSLLTHHHPMQKKAPCRCRTPACTSCPP